MPPIPKTRHLPVETKRPDGSRPGPALLVSYVYLTQFFKHREKYDYREWVMDSGAFSAFTSGVEISLEAYTEKCYELLRDDPTLKHVFALDVIGDPEGTLRNTEYMWRNGVPALPAFHYRSQWHYLKEMADKYPKIAFGGLVQRGKGGHGTKLTLKHRVEFLEGCFGRTWPKWVHGFGCCDRRLLARFPFSAVDSTTWLYGPARYGAVQLLGGRGGTLPSKTDNAKAFNSGVRTQILWYKEIEDDTRRRMRHVLHKHGFGPFTLHLASSGGELDLP